MADVRAVCPPASGTEEDPRVRALALRQGGSTANVLVTLAQLGLDTALVSAVGDDWQGRFLLDRLDACGVDRADVEVVAGDGASCPVLATPPGRSLLRHLAAGPRQGSSFSRRGSGRCAARGMRVRRRERRRTFPLGRSHWDK
ncbi:PfkB family carbohydrate kinase [Streptomyces sp. PSAA01]|nr:PfkB family carbohydrate kinase [Streptomyces sp. PSAA01]